MPITRELRERNCSIDWQMSANSYVPMHRFHDRPFQSALGWHSWRVVARLRLRRPLERDTGEEWSPTCATSQDIRRMHLRAANALCCRERGHPPAAAQNAAHEEARRAKGQATEAHGCRRHLETGQLLQHLAKPPLSRLTAHQETNRVFLQNSSTTQARLRSGARAAGTTRPISRRTLPPHTPTAPPSFPPPGAWRSG